VDVDLLIVGGGINGAGIARDAAGRGLKVLLCEQDDLAAHTSSSSTKLIHGGLRYIEQYEFALVRKALQERERLIEAAPHIIWPLRFVLPHDAHLRPVWVIRAGLFLYDHLARRRRLPSSKAVNLRTHPAGAALDAHFSRGFEYSDAWVEDSRLVVLNAMDAAARGATILTRTRFAAAVPDGPRWRATLVSNGATREIRAMLIVNAAGPWVDKVEGLALGGESAKSVRLVKGSHIIVRRLFTHQYAYIFQNPDGRIIFAIPYERDFTLIGTTDVEFAGDPATVAIDDGETRYLCEMANRYFRADIQARDIVRSYAGVRPLLDDESADPATITRDYSLEWLQSLAPMLSVYGGKITTYRRLAEEAVDRIIERFDRSASGRRAASDSRSRPERKAWTAQAPLPGGDMPDADFERFLQSVLVSYPWLPAPLLQRYARAYGTRIRTLLGSATGLGDLGSEVLPGLYAREIEYLREHEWARTAEDVLWRRSKLGLHLPDTALQTLDHWLSDLSHA
jgi:glycerol-3-phosphate dehydrogenase